LKVFPSLLFVTLRSFYTIKHVICQQHNPELFIKNAYTPALKRLAIYIIGIFTLLARRSQRADLNAPISLQPSAATNFSLMSCCLAAALILG